MSRGQARSAKNLCDWLFQRPEFERLLSTIVSVMAKKGTEHPRLGDVTEASRPHASHREVAELLEALGKRDVVAQRGSRLTIPSEYAFAEVAARCACSGPEEHRQAIFFWLVTGDPKSSRMRRAFGRFIVLAQNAIVLNDTWIAALEEAIGLSGEYAIERTANLVGKLASAQTQSMEYLTELTRDPAARRRRFVCLCLGHMTRRHNEAAQLLVQLMKDHVWNVWWSASLSLGKMAVDSVAARWALQMLTKSPVDSLRRRAIRGLTVMESGGQTETGFLKRLTSADHKWVYEVEKSQAKRAAVAEAAMARAVGHRTPNPDTGYWGPWGEVAEAAWRRFDTEIAGHASGQEEGDEFPDSDAAQCIIRAAKAQPEAAIDWAAALLSQGGLAEHRGVMWLQRFSPFGPERTFANVHELFEGSMSISTDHLAALLESCLAAHPHRAHVWLREIAPLHPGHLALAQLPLIARLDTISRLSEVYADLCRDQIPDTVLKNAVTVFADCRAYDLGDELYTTYHLLWNLTRTSSLRELLEQRPHLQKLVRSKMEGVEETTTALRRLHDLLGLIAEALQAHDEAGEMQYLNEAQQAAEQIAAEVGHEAAVPELRIIARIARLWNALIAKECNAARDRAQLAMELKSKEVVSGESLTLALEVTNTGRQAAANVSIELLASDNFKIREGVVQYPQLSPGEAQVAHFEVEPQTREGFRVNFEAAFDDRERQGKTTALAGVVTLVWQGADLSELRNPYVPGTPLREGSPVFFGRDELFEFLRGSLDGAHQENVLLLIGQRRTGKTSALKQLPGRIPENLLPVFIDCQGLLVRGIGDLLHRIASIIHLQLGRGGFEVTLPSLEDFRDSPDITFEQTFLGQVAEAVGDRLLVLIFDEFEEFEEKVTSGALPAEIFGYLRHLMQHIEGLSFVLAGTHKLEELSHEYWSFLFNIALCKRVGFLTPEATRAMIVEPVKDYISFDDMATDYLLKLTAGHPYFLQLSCWRVVQYCIEKGINNVVLRDLRDVTESIIERGEDNLSYLWDMATEEERLILLLLAKLTQEQGPAEVQSIVTAAKTRGMALEAADVRRLLPALLVKDILVETPTDPPRHDFRMKLFQIWVHESKSIDRLGDTTRHR